MQFFPTNSITVGIIPDRVVGIQLDLALPRIAVLIGAPSALAVLLVFAIIRLRYKLTFSIKRKDRADQRSRYELVVSSISQVQIPALLAHRVHR